MIVTLIAGRRPCLIRFLLPLAESFKGLCIRQGTVGDPLMKPAAVSERQASLCTSCVLIVEERWGARERGASTLASAPGHRLVTKGAALHPECSRVQQSLGLGWCVIDSSPAHAQHSGLRDYTSYAKISYIP
jgi:hypothetical protein